MKQKFNGTLFLLLYLTTAFALSGNAGPIISDPNLISSSHNSRRATPEVIARNQQCQSDLQEGNANLQAKNYALAEADFRDALALEHSGPAYLGLAEALVGQGKTAEARQAYFMLFHPGLRESWGGSYMPKAHLEYALLLNQSGEWAEAVAHYNASLADLPHGVLPPLTFLNPAMPQPGALAAAAHVGLGLYDNFEYEPDSSAKAFQEYNAALQLAPSSGLANYYYGYGWQRLDLKSPARAAAAPQAKAALAKAAASDDSAVKKAAQEMLQKMP